MSHGPRSAFDPDSNVEVAVDLVEVSRFHLVVRNRADGSTHALAYDGVAIGANATGDAYTLIMPRVLAQMQGFCE
ncbi:MULTISPECIES: hypothetical protein [unclassified Bradyrhizobium]|uniref:hypothetical protein n=1 Tax=unclassified Bradyrhizobium TaxID=2631580 RepID=UPI00211E1246|nr:MULTISPECIES: hypothetical protein [unclassified Bradyrhizobium]MDD1534580.1 hypothetical protein [Bradyrhizobium sp. WBOS8]MDD1581444.1 hypothetical protein [Bradyrhizobium sp. WBOS4]UUO49731.1 hypothetical protein DCM78_24160 [Bradyrhizobium sp. WBOS04]UUO58497.1 hypothetical protein DCM80_04440 [Bradyrhizobium sp. WBOS08]